MMLAYELHRPRPEQDQSTLRHEVILKATDDADVMRLLALISVFQQGPGNLEQALDLMLTHLATEEMPQAMRDAARPPEEEG